eukprot:COSAG06_NODE_8160_length_2255_cov_9.482375_2_plen_270_part_00
MMNVCVGAQVEASTCCVETLREQFEGVEWVLGNHTDELTPWVPVITHHLAEIQLKQEEEQEEDEEKKVLQGNGGGVEAAGGATSGASAGAGGSAGAGAAGRKAGRAMVERARAALRHAGVADTPPLQPSPAPSLSSSSLSTRRRQRQRPPRYWVLPCCLWDIGPGGAAAKFIGHDPTLGRYHTYLGHIEEIGLALGYDVVRDTMRIPSTRNICLVGSAPTTAAEASRRRRRGSEAAKAKQVVKKGGARRVRRPAAAEEEGGGAPAALFA